MHSNTQDDLKQLILMSWKDRWTEVEWSKHARTYLQTPSDMFHVAEALVSQAFIGSAPNTLLVEYIWYGISTGLFSYASVITAISKYDDLHKIDSSRELYMFLNKCLAVVNDRPLAEDSMDLCCSLRMILQWLLTNTESFLKGVSHGFMGASEELLRINCQILKQLTTSYRTSVLLTIARFEESGIWSHIETDLAVIKTSAGQHSLHSEISDSCHCVSQLSRCSITPRPVLPVRSHYPVSYSFTSLLMLEVQCRKYSEPEGIASQLASLAQVHGLTLTDVAFQSLRSCFLGFLNCLELDKDKEQDWYAMIFLQIPKVFLFFKSNPKCFDPNSSISRPEDWMDAALFEALNRLKELDCLIDSLDQLRNDFGWLKAIVEVFLLHNLLTNRSELNSFSQPSTNKQPNGVDKCLNPTIYIKTQQNLSSFIGALNPAQFNVDSDRFLKSFQTISPIDKFNRFLSAAATSNQLIPIANQLISVNDSLKASAGENIKTASVRAALFDSSFLLLCYMVKLFEKDRVLSSNLPKSNETSFAYNWISMWWPKDGEIYNPVTYEAVVSKVESYIQLLRGTSELQLIQTDWSDVATNLPQAVLELVIANQQGYLGASDLTCICSSIRDHFPLSAILAAVAVLGRNMRLNQESSDVLTALLEKSRVQSQVIPLYDERYALFEKITDQLIGDLLFKQSKPGKCVMTRNRPAAAILQEAFVESLELGWINIHSLNKFMFSYKYLGVVSFTRQIVDFIRQESRLASLETVFNLTFAVFRIDLLSFIIYLLKHGLEKHFMSDPYILTAPLGSFLAEIIVACLDNALNDRLLKQKSMVRGKDVISPFLFELSPTRKRESSMKVRRMLSCSTEHDLSSSGSNSELSPDDPLLVVFCDFVQNLWDLVVLKESKVIKDFAFTLVRHCLYSSPLLSRSVKEVMPLDMVKEFSNMLIKDSRELLFAACDLGNPEVRRIAADAVCHVSVVKNT